MNYRVILGCCLLVALSHTASAAKVYTWTDANGVIHYGEHPPIGVTAKKINARTGHSEPVPAQEETANEDATAAPKTQPSYKDPERCEIARTNLDAMNSNARVKIPDENGNLRYLTEEERQDKLAETRKAIEDSCD